MAIDQSIREEAKDMLVARIVKEYLDSPDFNGVYGANFTPDIAELVESLVEEGRLYANFGHVMSNPYIIGFPQESAADNLAIFHQRGGVAESVIYPTPGALIDARAGDQYPDAPYSAMLAFGHGQLEPRFFDPSVLARYRDDPRYDYTFDIDGQIRGVAVSPDTFITTLSIGFRRDNANDETVVGVPLRYLHDLSPTEQRYWQSHQSSDQKAFVLHPDFVRPHLLGEFPEKISPYEAMLWEMELTNEFCTAIGFPPLYRRTFRGEHRPTDFGYVIRPTKKEYNAFVEQLNKMLIDNMDAEFFRGVVEIYEERKDPFGSVYMAQRGTVAMLDDWMKKHTKQDPEEMVASSTKTLREIRKQRSSVAHDQKANDYDPEIFTTQRQMIREAYFAVRTVRQILGSHSKAASVKVPEDLDTPNVWGF